MRVLIADDSALIRDGLSHVLPTHGYDVAGAVGDLPALLAAAEATVPDVALIDIRMPPTFTDEGITAARTIRHRFPGVGVIVLSQHVEAEYALTLLDRIRRPPVTCSRTASPTSVSLPARSSASPRARR